MDWLRAVAQLREVGAAGVLVTVIEVRGHAPRAAGTKMVVAAERAWGSIGGGNLEASALVKARELLADGSCQPETSTVRLNPHSPGEFGRQCCGGEVTLLFEPLPARPTVAIFGVGHVGFELARILSRWELNLVLVDSREEELDPLRLLEITDGPAEVSVRRALIGETVLDRLPVGAQVLIMTHDHAEDFALCDAALRLVAAHQAARPTATHQRSMPEAEEGGSRFGYLGLIGSSAKWSRFRRNLAELGHPAELISSINCPIGLPAISGKQPAMIALSVAAELQIRLQAAVVTR